MSEFRQDPPWAADYPDVQPPRGLHVRQTGKLPEVVTKYGNWGDRQILICGGPNMVAATKEALIAKGAPARTHPARSAIRLKEPHPRQHRHTLIKINPRVRSTNGKDARCADVRVQAATDVGGNPHP